MLLVTPQATRSLRPIMTAGTPPYATPATLNDPPERCTSCQKPLTPNGTCGSLATSGLPVVVRLAASAQLLLPCPASRSLAVTPADASGASAAEYEERGRMLSS